MSPSSLGCDFVTYLIRCRSKLRLEWRKDGIDELITTVNSYFQFGSTTLRRNKLKRNSNLIGVAS